MINKIKKVAKSSIYIILSIFISLFISVSSFFILVFVYPCKNTGVCDGVDGLCDDFVWMECTKQVQKYPIIIFFIMLILIYIRKRRKKI